MCVGRLKCASNGRNRIAKRNGCLTHTISEGFAGFDGSICLCFFALNTIRCGSPLSCSRNDSRISVMCRWAIEWSSLVVLIRYKEIHVQSSVLKSRIHFPVSYVSPSGGSVGLSASHSQFPMPMVQCPGPSPSACGGCP